jgi:hypothetical protein
MNRDSETVNPELTIGDSALSEIYSRIDLTENQVG